MPKHVVDLPDFANPAVGCDIELVQLRHHLDEPLVPAAAEGAYDAAVELWRARVADGLAFDAPSLMLAYDGGRWTGIVVSYVHKRAVCDAVRAMEPKARAALYGGDGGPWPLVAGIHLTVVTSDDLVPATLRPPSMLVGGGTATLSCTEGLDPCDLDGTVLGVAGAARRALLEEFGVAAAERSGMPAIRVLGAYRHLELAEIVLVAVADLRRSVIPLPFARIAASRLTSRWEPEELQALPLRDVLAGRTGGLGMPLGPHSLRALDMMRRYEETIRAVPLA